MRKLILTLLAICAVSLATAGIAAADVSYTTPGTYTFTDPAGVTQVLIQAWGGGGDGGCQIFFEGGGGGGGGAFAQSTVAVTPGANYTVTVGAGGLGGANLVCPHNGGNSSFGTQVVAAGGAGGDSNGNVGAGGLASNSTGQITFSGGNGGLGNHGTVGAGGGGAAGTNGPGGNGSVSNFTGTSGGIPGTGGGAGGYGTGNSTSTPGASPGGGGGGAGGTGVPASGGNGAVLIQFSQQVCSNCPPYVEYTGAAGGGAAAPAGASPLSADATVAAPASTVFLDPGDVFKLNAAKTGYDYVDGFTLLNSPGWCNSTPNTPDSGYWCGVTPLPIIPAPITSFKQAEADPPSCTLSNADVLPISSRNGGAISAIIQMTCNEKLPAIFTWTQLVKLKALGQFPGNTKASNAQSWVNTSNPQPPPGVVYSCDAASWITKGFVIYKIYIDYVLVGPDGHVYQSPQWSSGNFTLLASKRSPVCA